MAELVEVYFVTTLYVMATLLNVACLVGVVKLMWFHPRSVLPGDVTQHKPSCLMM